MGLSHCACPHQASFASPLQPTHGRLLSRLFTVDMQIITGIFGVPPVVVVEVNIYREILRDHQFLDVDVPVPPNGTATKEAFVKPATMNDLRVVWDNVGGGV